MGRVFFNTRSNIDTTSITSTTTYEMTEADSNKTFLVSGGAQTVTLLPAADLVEGWNCRFITTASPSGAKTIGAGSTIMHGATSNADTAAVAASDGTAKTSIAINAASQAGNWLDIVCDGNAYYVNGAAGQNAAFTFA